MLICFSTRGKKFRNSSERNRFFKELYGWEQRLRKGRNTYVYKRNGLLDEIKHLKLDQSTFLIEESEVEKILEFFRAWEKKVMWRMLKVILEEW